MSGILDSKSRVLDTIVTLEGRRQLAAGGLQVKYVSFTDALTFYSSDLTSGSTDASTRLYFEQCNLPQDQVVFNADASGKLSSFNIDSGTQLKDGRVLVYSFDALTSSVLTGSTQGVRALVGPDLIDAADQLLTSSIDRLQQLYVIGTHDRIFEDDGFALGNSQVEFVIHNKRPLVDPNQHSAHVNSLESLFNDVRLSNLTNFKFLPPVNLIEDQSLDKSDPRATAAHHLGHYKPWGRTHIAGLTGAQLEAELAYYERVGCCRSISFEPTSRDNRLLAQAFEITYDKIAKMDVIDFGTYTHKNVVKRAFFVGKLLTDENNTHTFIHVFTLVFG